MNKLTPAQKKKIAARIKELDPTGKVVVLEPNAAHNGGTISYAKDSGVTFGETISKLTDEEYVRAYLVVHLIYDLRYPPECIDVEKGYTIGRPTGKSAQLDVRVRDERRKKKTQTFMLIEAKRPDDYGSYTELIEDQLFSPGNQEHAAGVKYIAWYTLEFQDENFRDKAIIVEFPKYPKHAEWVDAGEPGHNLDLPKEYGTVRKHTYVKGSETDLRTDLTREELTKLQRDFHNVLWGGAKMGDTDVFNNLMKMFIAKIYDEQTTENGHPYKFQTELKDGAPETAAEILEKVNALYGDALRHYFKYSEDVVSRQSINKEKFKPEKVAYVMEKLESVSLIENKFEDDVLGVFFEAIVRTGFKQERGQFFTHTNIVKFIAHALELDRWAIDSINGTSPSLPYLMDPSCGSGSFLIEAMRFVTRAVLHTNKADLKNTLLVRNYVEEWFQPNSKNRNIHNRWAREFIYGIDDNEDLAMATKVNMILHGDGNANIEKADGLAAFDSYNRTRTRQKVADLNHPYKGLPRNEQFDCVVSNPPFSLKEDARTLSAYGTRFAYAERKNSENLFLERWYQLLREGGRLGVVLPDSVFDTNENLYIRMFLYRFFSIRAVVSLPPVTFQPYTPTKTSLLFAVKKTKKQVEAWDAAWRKAANEYGKLRQGKVPKLVIANEKIRRALIDLANRADFEWYPSTNILVKQTLPQTVREDFAKAVESNARQKAKLIEILKAYDKIVAENDLAGVPNEPAAKEAVGRLLRDRFTPALAAMSLPLLVEATYDDILEAAELNYSEDPKGQNYCNAWWCFAEVAAQAGINHPIFFAEAKHVGFKRTTRHPEGIPQANDLFEVDENGDVNIDTENPKSILDHLRASRIFENSSNAR